VIGKWCELVTQIMLCTDLEDINTEEICKEINDENLNQQDDRSAEDNG